MPGARRCSARWRMREIRVRVWDTILQGWHKGSVDLSYNKDGTVSLYEPRFIFLRFTGLKDRNGVDIFEGNILKYILAFPTAQTHTGDNIPGGTYTEPDEPFLGWVVGEVIYDEERCMFSTSERTVRHCQDQRPTLIDLDSDYLPVVNRESYCRAYLQGLCWQSDKRACSCDDCWILEQLGCKSWEQLDAVLNTVEVIGDIHENPELLEEE